MQSDKDVSIPEIKRVILAYQEKLVMAENLGQALVEIFGIRTATYYSGPRYSTNHSNITGHSNIEYD